MSMIINEEQYAPTANPRISFEKDLFSIIVTSDGTSGPQWVEYSDEPMNEITQSILGSNAFRPTDGVSRKVIIVPGSTYKENRVRVQHIWMDSRNGKFGPNIEIVDLETMCLLREALSNDDILGMNLKWIAGMHVPVKSSSPEDPLKYLLALYPQKSKSIEPFVLKRVDSWTMEGGFAFIDSSYKVPVELKV